MEKTYAIAYFDQKPTLVVLLERIKFQERAEVGSTAVGPCTETVLKNIQGMNHIGNNYV